MIMLIKLIKECDFTQTTGGLDAGDIIAIITAVIMASLSAFSVYYAYSAIKIARKALKESKRNTITSTVLETRSDFDAKFSQMNKLGTLLSTYLGLPEGTIVRKKLTDKEKIGFRNYYDIKKKEDDYQQHRKDVKGVFRKYEILLRTSSLSKENAKLLISDSSFYFINNILIPLEPELEGNLKNINKIKDQYKEILQLYS